MKSIPKSGTKLHLIRLYKIYFKLYSFWLYIDFYLVNYNFFLSYFFISYRYRIQNYQLHINPMHVMYPHSSFYLFFIYACIHLCTYLSVYILTKQIYKSWCWFSEIQINFISSYKYNFLSESKAFLFLGPISTSIVW